MAPASDVVDSWKGIAAYLGRDVRTVMRWEQTRGLPVHRLPGGPKSAVYALRAELEAWRRNRGIHAIGEQERGQPVVPAGPQPKTSVAVLPFANLSADKENEYFSDGLADEIISDLARLHGLRVTARTSSFAFRGKEQDVREIGARLGVDNLIEGSVQRVGSRVRVYVQLVSCSDGCHIWSDRYDRELTDIFAVQEEIAASVASALKLTVEPPHSAPKKKIGNLEAYNLWLQGRHYRFSLRTVDDITKARECFAQAIALDPDFAAAHLAAAELLLNLAVLGLAPPQQVAREGRAEIAKALALDDGLGEAHAVAGVFRALFDFDWTGAQAAFEKALALNPGAPSIRRRLAGCVLIPLLRLDDAEAEARYAMELDPMCPESHFLMVLILFFKREYDRAEAMIRTTAELGSASPLILWVSGMIAAKRSNFPAAIERCEDAVRAYGSAPLVTAGLGMLYAMAGRKDQARQLLAQIDLAGQQGYVSPIYRAIVYMGLGETDRAFEWLARAVECHDPHILHLPAKPIYDSLRQDGRFQMLLRKMNLTPTV
jgi:TolB-like protein/Tfp pilus assembly protein PilF